MDYKQNINVLDEALTYNYNEDIQRKILLLDIIFQKVFEKYLC